MRRKVSPLENTRRNKGEEMFVSKDAKSVRRGQRTAPRTEVCRPCLVWREELPEHTLQGVIMDLNPYGMRIRMLAPVETGTDIMVQMMRDEEFRVPLSPPIKARIVRMTSSMEGFVDHGIKVRVAKIRRIQEQRMITREPQRPRRRMGTRMYSLMDLTVDDHGVRRTGRNRG